MRSAGGADWSPWPPWWGRPWSRTWACRLRRAVGRSVGPPDLRAGVRDRGARAPAASSGCHPDHRAGRWSGLAGLHTTDVLARRCARLAGRTGRPGRPGGGDRGPAPGPAGCAEPSAVRSALPSYEPAVAPVVREHPQHRRAAILTIGLVGGLASPVFTPLTSWLADALGWRGGLVALAALVGATVVPHLGLPAAPSRRPFGRPS